MNTETESVNYTDEKKTKYPPLEIVAPVLFAFIFIVTLIYSRLEPNVEHVSAEYVKEHAGKPGYVLVDTRPLESYMGKSPRPGVPGGHIPGAVSFPFANLNAVGAYGLLAEAGITKDKIIIVYCNTGVLSGRFADLLIRKFNFSASKLKNYSGSTVEWVKDPNNTLLPEDHETGFFTDTDSQRFRGK